MREKHMDSSTRRLNVLQAEVERLTDYLTALPPEAWHRPSACDRWQVADVVAHLTAGGHNVARSVARGLQGDVGPPAGSPALSAHDEDAHRERMAQSALAHRTQLGDHVLAAFIASNEALHQQLAALAPPAWETLCYHPARSMPVRMLVEHRITEVVMHGWDIRAPSDPSTHLAPESFPAFFTIIMERVVTRAFRSDARRSRPIGYRFMVTGPLTTTTDIVLSPDGACVAPTGQAEVAVAAQCKVPALHLAATPPFNPPHRMAEWLPGVVNGQTVGAGHFNQLEAPDQVNAMIEGFLRHHV
jgi:uncharacterized protein (TIGR03083 family)